MPWKGVTVQEQRENFLRDYHLRYYNLSELAERFSISRKTAHRWIERYHEHGQEGLVDRPRRPLSCPWQTEQRIREALIELRLAHASWGPVYYSTYYRDAIPAGIFVTVKTTPPCSQL